MGTEEHVTLSAFIVFIIERAKQSGWLPFIGQATDKLNVALSAIMAAAATVGIQLAPGSGGDFAITGNLFHIGKTIVEQFVFNEAGYRIYKRR
jgi:hypothetical protein